jgi:hypothetical protein
MHTKYGPKKLTFFIVSERSLTLVIPAVSLGGLLPELSMLIHAPIR